MKSKIILFFLLIISVKTNAQNGLSGVYVNHPFIIGIDTVYSYLQGKVLDSISFKPLANAKIKMFTSRGDALATQTDSAGNFKINTLPSNNKVKIICLPDSTNKTNEWSINTEGMSEPIQLNLYFYFGK